MDDTMTGVSTAPIQRTSARVIPVDAGGRVLLLHGHDPARPEWSYWFTIGGAVERGVPSGCGRTRALGGNRHRDHRATARPAVSPRHPRLLYDGVDFVADESFFAVRLDDVAISFDGIQGNEVRRSSRLLAEPAGKS
jgi:hypothetical protein